MAPVEPAGRCRVEVVYGAAPGTVERLTVELAPGATVLHALRASGLLERHPEIDLGSQRIGIWGRLKSLSDPVRDRDRVEVYRGLKVDPKEARRLRLRGQKQR
ncbi:RnfH family protein [Aquabacterium sp. A7-Y]|uniref:RnfH family protein n=1 Tax=Aquabacterium sp. A7-Y TaxID=1349605 RepID=UPI00223E1388|nr:RnfH family protein [Aquabacterium sp. A7-Y]MCW7541219.1 RnfH family protein [Aquabacterium sp. A7-Y]